MIDLRATGPARQRKFERTKHRIIVAQRPQVHSVSPSSRPHPRRGWPTRTVGWATGARSHELPHSGCASDAPSCRRKKRDRPRRLALRRLATASDDTCADSRRPAPGLQRSAATLWRSIPTLRRAFATLRRSVPGLRRSAPRFRRIATTLRSHSLTLRRRVTTLRRSATRLRRSAPNFHQPRSTSKIDGWPAPSGVVVTMIDLRAPPGYNSSTKAG